MRIKKLLVLLFISAFAIFKADAAVVKPVATFAGWSFSTNDSHKNSKDYATLCFYKVITKKASSPLLEQGYKAVRLYPKSSRAVCNGEIYYVDLVGRQIFIRKPFPSRKEEEIKNHLKMFSSTNAVSLLEKARADELVAITEAQRNAYLSKFEGAKDLPSIYEFENVYKNNDPDNLIPKLAGLKAELEYRQYRDRYAGAATADQLSEFIRQYEGSDPDNLVPEAKKRLPVIQRQEDEALKRKEREENLKKLESAIAFCKTETSEARQAINREQKIGRVSGFVNKVTLHQAGETIIECRDRTAKDYSEYRKLGGKKSLSEIK